MATITSSTPLAAAARMTTITTTTPLALLPGWPPSPLQPPYHCCQPGHDGQDHHCKCPWPLLPGCPVSPLQPLCHCCQGRQDHHCNPLPTAARVARIIRNNTVAFVTPPQFATANDVNVYTIDRVLVTSLFSALIRSNTLLCVHSNTELRTVIPILLADASADQTQHTISVTQMRKPARTQKRL
jgi:hypothetical protein